MRKMWIKIIGTAALAFMLCLSGLAMSGEYHIQRFVDNGNGTVTDTRTGLMWTKDANPFGRLTWDDAMARCESYSISGIGGWRLPNIEELMFLHYPMQGEHPFTGFQATQYWSSTTGFDERKAFYVDMGTFLMIDWWKTNTYNVWPVRTAQ